MYHVIRNEARPVYKVRRAENRNQRKLSRRLSRYGSDTVTLTLANGTRAVYRASDVVSGTVKRDAQRLAKRTGGTFVTG